MKKLLFMASLAALSFAIACEKGEKAASDYTSAATCSAASAAATYNNAVKDILDNSCALGGCHDAATKEKGVDLSTFAMAKDDFTNGGSLCTIYHDCVAMPKGGAKLDAATIETLTCWVKNGCPQ